MRCPYCKIHDDTLGPNGYCRHCGKDVQTPLASELYSDGIPNDTHREAYKREQALAERAFRNKELLAALGLLLIAVTPTLVLWAKENRQESARLQALAELPGRGQAVEGRVTASTTQDEGKAGQTDFIEYEYEAEGTLYRGSFTRRSDPRLSDSLPTIGDGQPLAVLYHPERPETHLRNEADGRPPRVEGRLREVPLSNAWRMVNLACVLAGSVGVFLILDALRRSRASAAGR